MKNISRALLLSLVAIIGLSAAAFAQTSPNKQFGDTKVGISNFGKMDDHLYRGGRPGGKDFATLKALGINTIIDLTDNSGNEQAQAEAAGLKYVNIAIPDKSYPTDEIVAQFIKTMNDPQTGVAYIHCAGGRHRTGDMGAVYRAEEGWTYENAMQEMENYDFYTANGHQTQKDFVIDYFKKVAARPKAAPPVAVIGVKKQ